MPKVREAIKLIEADGWRKVATKGSHRQFKHPVKTGRVTIAGRLSDDLHQARALVHESKLARHGPDHRCFIDRRRRKLGGPCRSSHSAYCTRAALRPFSHRVSWLEDHRR